MEVSTRYSFATDSRYQAIPTTTENKNDAKQKMSDENPESVSERDQWVLVEKDTSEEDIESDTSAWQVRPNGASVATFSTTTFRPIKCPNTSQISPHHFHPRTPKQFTEDGTVAAPAVRQRKNLPPVAAAFTENQREKERYNEVCNIITKVACAALILGVFAFIKNK